MEGQWIRLRQPQPFAVDIWRDRQDVEFRYVFLFILPRDKQLLFVSTKHSYWSQLPACWPPSSPKCQTALRGPKRQEHAWVLQECQPKRLPNTDYLSFCLGRSFPPKRVVTSFQTREIVTRAGANSFSPLPNQLHLRKRGPSRSHSQVPLKWREPHFGPGRLHPWDQDPKEPQRIESIRDPVRGLAGHKWQVFQEFVFECFWGSLCVQMDLNCHGLGHFLA